MKEITDLQREMLKKYHLDAMVTMTPENITYVTGAYIPTQVTVRSRKVIHIITEKHDPVVIVVNIEEPIMRAQSWMDPKSIISYNEFTQNPMMIAIDKLKEFGMETKRIGMELSYLSAIDMDLMHRGRRCHRGDERQKRDEIPDHQTRDRQRRRRVRRDALHQDAVRA